MESTSRLRAGSGTIGTRRLLQRGLPATIGRDASLHFADGVVGKVTMRDPASAGSPFPDTLIVPALANAHDHGRGWKTLAYGAADTAVEAWVPATYTIPRLDPYVVAALAFARMARAGITSIVHCHLSSDRAGLIEAATAVAQAARDVGVRVGFVVPLRDRHRLGYGADDNILACMMPSDVEEISARWLRPIAAIEEQLDTVDEIAERCETPQFLVQYGLVGLEWCSDELLRNVARRAEASRRRVHMHLLESRYQRRWADNTYREGAVAHLAELGVLSDRLTVAHGTWLRPEESALLAANDVTVSINTSSNLRLRSGIAPLAAMNAAKVPFAIGLDALALDDDDDMLREMRLAHLLHAGQGFHVDVTREEIFRAASVTGACAACGKSSAGELSAGAPADFIVLDYARLAADIPERLDKPFVTFFSRATSAHVAAVYCAGREIVSNGRVLGIDEPALLHELQRQTELAAGEIAALRPLLKRFQLGLERFYSGTVQDCPL